MRQVRSFQSFLLYQAPRLTAPKSFPYEQIPKLSSGEAGYYAFLLPEDDRPHGYIAPSVVEQMPWTSDFVVDPTQQPRRVTLLDTSKGTDTAAACNASFRALLQAAQDKGVFAKTLGRKAEGEDFRIMAARNYQGKRALVQLRRSAAPLFGIANRGAHMTVYTRSPDGTYQFWVPRRSRHLRTYPGMLDNTVAGGVKAEESPLECIIHEADEEASLPEDFVAKHVRPVGMITYITQTGSGGGSDAQAAVGGFDVGLCVPDVLYNYDLEVPAELVDTVVPKPRDDEVEEFCLWDLATVQEAMAKGEFKPNTALALIDFFIRHGIVNEENEPDFVDIVSRLHRKLHVPTSRQW